MSLDLFPLDAPGVTVRPIERMDGEMVFGAMGMTWEADVHFLLKRTLALRGACGPAGHHTVTILDRMMNAPTGPDATFASKLAG